MNLCTMFFYTNTDADVNNGALLTFGSCRAGLDKVALLSLGGYCVLWCALRACSVGC